mgnify:CR=1 FL=1
MSDNKVKKFESKARLKELIPYETLKAMGLKANDVFCDIGAGTGIFTFAASGIGSNVSGRSTLTGRYPSFSRKFASVCMSWEFS